MHKQTNLKDIKGLSDFKKAYKDQYNNDSLPPSAGGQVILPHGGTAHIKIPVRIKGGISTSLTIKHNLIALWVLYRYPKRTDPQQILAMIDNGDESNIKETTIPDMVSSFVQDCLDEWEHDTGRGLSDFVTEKMIKDMLDSEDHEIYLSLMSIIRRK